MIGRLFLNDRVFKVDVEDYKIISMVDDGLAEDESLPLKAIKQEVRN